MKALTIQQPWAQLCVVGSKQFETRSWATAHRGLLAIHAAKGLSLIGGREMLRECLVDKPEPGDEFLSAGIVLDGPEGWDLPRGAVIGTVSVVDCVRVERVELTEQEAAVGCYEDGRWAWKLADPVLFDKPIPATGKLGLWDWDERRFRG